MHPRSGIRNFKRDIDERADLFALAVTLVECLTGRNPYRDGARDPMEVVRRIEASPLPVPAMGWDLNNQFADFLAAMGQRRAMPPTNGYRGYSGQEKCTEFMVSEGIWNSSFILRCT